MLKDPLTLARHVGGCFLAESEARGRAAICLSMFCGGRGGARSGGGGGREISAQETVWITKEARGGDERLGSGPQILSEAGARVAAASARAALSVGANRHPGTRGGIAGARRAPWARRKIFNNQTLRAARAGRRGAAAGGDEGFKAYLRVYKRVCKRAERVQAVGCLTKLAPNRCRAKNLARPARRPHTQDSPDSKLLP